MKKIFFMSLLLTQLVGCTEEVGSKKWCENIKNKPTGELTANEAADFAKHCLLK